MPEPALRLTNIEKRYGSTLAVAGIDLDVQEGEFATLLGPSGCGKTTTLGLIAGFFPPTRGEIFLKGAPVANKPPFRRNIGVVFQDYALFPHMTIKENVAFGLAMRKVARHDIAVRVAEALDMVKLTGLEDRRPLEISGGQRQRVALARALVIRPHLLLLDEPLSNLDLKLREEMRIEILALQRRLGIATVFVTHDQGEALVMSDRIAVMNEGRIEQIGAPSQIYEKPTTRFVAQFIGRMNFIAGSVEEVRGEYVVLRLGNAATLTLPAPTRMEKGGIVEVAVRPERVRLAVAPMPLNALSLQCVTTHVLYLGSVREIHVRFDNGEKGMAEAPNVGSDIEIAPGSRLWFTAPAESCFVITR